MKTNIILILIFLSLNNFVYSQAFRLGFAGNFLTGNKYYNYQVGPSVLAEYKFDNIPLTINGSVRLLFISELTEKYLPGYNNNAVGFGASVNYFPFIWHIQPYIGLGLYYYSNDIKAGGNVAEVDQHINYISNADNNFSAELTGGLKFSAQTPINFIVEVTQSFSKQADLISSDPVSHIILEKKKISIFNSLFVRLGILFEI